jgi:hypothetical protein
MTGRDGKIVRHKTWKGCSEIMQDKRTAAGIWASILRTVLGIRIRMFLGLAFSHKGVERTEILLAK